MTTTEIVWALQARFRLDFIDWREKDNWARNSVGNLLRELVKQGLVQRLHDPTANTGESGRWRWKENGCESLGDLAALAQASGVATNSEALPYEAEDEQAEPPRILWRLQLLRRWSHEEQEGHPQVFPLSA